MGFETKPPIRVGGEAPAGHQSGGCTRRHPSTKLVQNQYHFEVYLGYVVLQPYSEYAARILAMTVE